MSHVTASLWRREKMAAKKLCRNLGCNAEFAVGEEEECVHHSGAPFFHEGFKGWTCCEQKSTDFHTFLNFKGCKRGKHCSEEREEKKSEEKKTVSVAEVEPEVVSIERDDEWRELIIREMESVFAESKESFAKKTQICQKCHQKRDEAREEQQCRFHSGATIFHETLKYWSCCPQKKFTDFSEFQEFPGCQQSPRHVFAVPEARVRRDWFQTPTHVTLVLYGLNGARAANSRVRSDGHVIRAEFGDAEGNALFSEEWELFSRISQKRSEVVVEKTRAELRLLKERAREQWTQCLEIE